MQGNCVVETGWRMRRKEVAGEICLRNSRVTQGYRADADDDDDKDSITLSISCRMS